MEEKEIVELSMPMEDWHKIFSFLHDHNLESSPMGEYEDLKDIVMEAQQQYLAIIHQQTDVEAPAQLKLFNQQELDDESTKN